MNNLTRPLICWEGVMWVIKRHHIFRTSFNLSQVQAQDADSGRNAMLTYSITSGDDLNQFIIDPETGYISVAASLDREAVS